MSAMEPTDAIEGGTAYEQLDELYDVWCAEVVEDVPFYLNLAAALEHELGQDGLDIVELGGGSGRVGVPLAQAGHRVTAIDASPAQLARFRARAGGADLEALPQTIVGDMRELEQLVPPESADLIVAPFRALLHVTPARDGLFRSVHGVLRPNGVFAFDVFHPSAELVGTTHGRWLHRREELTRGGRWRFQERARYLPEAAAEPGGLKLEVDVRCRWSPSRRGRQLTTLPLADPAPGAPTERRTRLDLQLVPAERWAASLEQADFGIDGAYGWFDARPLDAEDEDSIWVARRGAATT